MTDGPLASGDEDDRIYDALAEWDRRRRHGAEPTAEELCPDPRALGKWLGGEIGGERGWEARRGLDRARRADPGSAGRVHPPQIPGIVVEREVGRGAMGV